MKRIYIVIAGVILAILILISIVLSFAQKSTINNQNNTPFPTSVPGQSGTAGRTNPQNNQVASSFPVDTSAIPYTETLDYKAAYVPSLNKVVVEQKTPQAKEQFTQWANQNQLGDLLNNKQYILYTDQKIIPTPSDSVHKLQSQMTNFFQLMNDLTNIQNGTGSNSTTPIPTPTTSEKKSSPTSTPVPKINQSKVYYAQCGDQGSLSLPDGCNLCSAGCGPTTVAMIAASYLGNKYDPKAIVGMYQSKGYLLGCEGSRYSDAYSLLQGLGLKTTDYITFNAEKADTVVPQLRKYLDSGWTFFTLASFCDNGCGHYFWITDIDSKGDIFAYDPAYGRYEIPYNENSRYPYPLYRLAFGVKK